MSNKSIIIIGAGVAGLAAGCYAQMNGFDSQIFETHDLPGGLCTAWDRKGYIFDGCIHYLFGSGEGQPFNQTWQELGAVQERPFINHSEFMRITDGTGAAARTFIAYADPDRLEAHMKELSPEDSKLSEGFCDGIRQFTTFDMAMLQEKPRSLLTAEEWGQFGLKVMPFALPLAKWGRMSAKEFGDKFKDPLLRRALPQMFGWADIPVMVGMSLLAYMHTHNAGFPAGGSLEFVRAIEQRYLSLGGQIHYKAQVEKILVENERGNGARAVGVRLYNDEIHHADYVISAADGHGTIFDMLGGDFVDRDIKRTYDGRFRIHSQVQVSLGVNRDLSGTPHSVTYLLDKPLLIAGEERDAIWVKHYNFDPTLAPAGKSCIIVMIESNYAYWQRIYGRRLYDTEQLQVADIVIDFLETIYPGIRADVEVKDVATPLSYERYTGNWLGSTCGWLMTTKTMMTMIQGMDKTLPGLDNLYLCGQWVEPGGSVPVVAMSGRNAVQLICDAEERPFTTTHPT
ncbi:MAG: NAD(P)/FAD-dependent oxidoreductase [Ardenticatenaceae bacterium]|nr:NAD(P)/FAD-dependent oxidoreductase [Ardenticatenaceae bacterium]